MIHATAGVWRAHGEKVTFAWWVLRQHFSQRQRRWMGGMEGSLWWLLRLVCVCGGAAPGAVAYPATALAWKHQLLGLQPMDAQGAHYGCPLPDGPGPTRGWAGRSLSCWKAGCIGVAGTLSAQLRMMESFPLRAGSSASWPPSCRSKLLWGWQVHTAGPD